MFYGHFARFTRFVLFWPMVVVALSITALHALVETINSFSTDPPIARPLPTYVTQSREFNKAAKAVEQMQRNTLIALRQRERLAYIGEAGTEINHDIRNVLSSATL